MAISFPNNPTTNQTFTVGSKTWIWNGYAWDIQNSNTAIVTAQLAYNQANTANTNANTAYYTALTSNNYNINYTNNIVSNYLPLSGGTLSGTLNANTITVSNTTVITNLNADKLDGQDGSYYAANSTVVKLTGDQSISGIKTFSNTIGIGTSSPQTGVTLLHLSDGNTANSNLVTSDFGLITAQNTAPGFSIVSSSDLSAQHRGVFKATRSRGTLSNPTAPLVNDYTFSLLGAIYNGTTSYATAAINMEVDGTVSSAASPQRITFLTGNTNTRIERVRIDANGNVGIGTTSPMYNLDVNGTANTGALTATSVTTNNIVANTITISKTIAPRVLASTSNSATPSLNTDNYDMMVITGQSVAITSFTTNLTGTPVNGQKLWIAITGTNAIAITWGASFESSTTTLPTTTVTTNRLDVGFVWNVATSKWRCVAST